MIPTKLNLAVFDPEGSLWSTLKENVGKIGASRVVIYTKLADSLLSFVKAAVGEVYEPGAIFIPVGHAGLLTHLNEAYWSCQAPTVFVRLDPEYAGDLDAFKEEVQGMCPSLRLEFFSM